MSYILKKTTGSDVDWAGVNIGEIYNECVDKKEVEFLTANGSGPHTMYDANQWYFSSVSKKPFISMDKYSTEDTSFE